MPSQRKTPEYRAVIDAMVEVCRIGQGQVGAELARRGIWNRNANERFLTDDHRMNVILSGLTELDRDALGIALTKQFEAGVFEAIKVLEQKGITPFEDGYEGSPHEDFVGRLVGWQWPEK
jgi:hypothetical protein